MLEIRKVLYPTDFSESAEGALPLAVRFADLHGAELHLLHVLVLHAADTAALESHYEELGAEARAELEAMAREGPVERLRLVPAVRRGISAAPVILEYASEADVDLIVLGSHGRRGLRRMLLGSVAEEVVRLAPCPVLTVRGRRREEGEGAEDGRGAIRKVLVPVDFSSHARLALESGVEIAVAFGAGLFLLHVIEQFAYPDFYLPLSVPELDVVELRRKARERLEELAAEARASHPDADLEVEVEVTVGRTAREIADVAGSAGADLIVIASHGLQGLERLLLGSVTERVMRQAPCSVLTVKAFGKRLEARPGS